LCLQSLIKSWAVGGLLGFGGFTFGARYKRQDDFAPELQDNDIINVGLMYGFATANVSVGYELNRFGESDLDDAHIFVVSGDLGILPGVTLKADVSYNTDDVEARDDEDIEQDDTIGGVLSVQLDY
jgi:predicted porin